MTGENVFIKYMHDKSYLKWLFTLNARNEGWITLPTLIGIKNFTLWSTYLGILSSKVFSSSMLLYLCSESDLSLFALSSGMLWAAWSCWWQKITWLFTWMEQLLVGRCPASAGWRDATRWLTGSKTEYHNSLWKMWWKWEYSQECITNVVDAKDKWWCNLNLLWIKLLLEGGKHHEQLNVSCRLRKNLKCLIIAHPTWFIRTVLAISRPFIRWGYI